MYGRSEATKLIADHEARGHKPACTAPPIAGVRPFSAQHTGGRKTHRERPRALGRGRIGDGYFTVALPLLRKGKTTTPRFSLARRDHRGRLRRW